MSLKQFAGKFYMSQVRFPQSLERDAFLQINGEGEG